MLYWLWTVVLGFILLMALAAIQSPAWLTLCLMVAFVLVRLLRRKVAPSSADINVSIRVLVEPPAGFLTRNRQN